VLTTTGVLHACPFAVEVDRGHYYLGDIATSASEALTRWQRFRDWIDGTLTPRAQSVGVHPCVVCTAWEGSGPGKAG
jgi:hypothetical protein